MSVAEVELPMFENVIEFDAFKMNPPMQTV